MLDKDPFTIVYEGIWDMLEANADFCTLVKPGNRIKYNGPARPAIKDEISTADTPEVRVVPLSTEYHLQRTSNGTSITKTYGIEVSSGSTIAANGVWAVEWQILRAVSNWQTYLSNLVWPEGSDGSEFVKLCKPLSAAEGVRRTDLNRGIYGWSLVWAVEVEMWFCNDAIQN